MDIHVNYSKNVLDDFRTKGIGDIKKRLYITSLEFFILILYKLKCLYNFLLKGRIAKYIE